MAFKTSNSKELFLLPTGNFRCRVRPLQEDAKCISRSAWAQERLPNSVQNVLPHFISTHVQHQLGQARPNGERRRQQEPQWDAPDDDEALWTLVSEKKPTEKKAVLYLGNLKPGVKESEIIDYVNRRSENLGALPPTIHNCKIFEKEVEEGEIIEFCGARLTIDKRSSKLLCHRKFWLGHSYARPWNFPDPSEAAYSKNGKPK